MIRSDAERDVLLAFCHNGNVAFCFLEALMGSWKEDLRRPEDGEKRRLGEWQGSMGPYIHENRSRVARYLVEETDYQWLWFVDNDMRWPVDTLYRMLEAAERYETPILGAAYWNTFGPEIRGLSWLQFAEEGFHTLQDLPRYGSKDGEVIERPIQVGAVGMGCTLIHRDVLEKLARQYAEDPWPFFAADILTICKDGAVLGGRSPEEVKAVGAEHLKSGVTYCSRVGEDVTFCLRAQQHGYKSYGLATVVAEHFKAQWVEHGYAASAGSL